MSTASTGFPAASVAATSSIARATSCATAVTVGTKSVMTASTYGSRSNGRNASAYVWAVAPPSMSTGFARLASGGRSAASAPCESSDNSGSSSPAASQASAQRIPSPPAFVSTATLRPCGSGWLDSSVATSISSSREVARMTPAWWNSASTAASEPASAAVWDFAARWPIVVVPLFSARIGLRRATLRASWPNRRGLPNDSRYRRMTCVVGSSSHHSRRSLDETSALFPIETNDESPSPRASAASRTAIARAPLCEENPMLPLGAKRAAKVAFRLVPATAIPRQFGPISRPPLARTARAAAAAAPDRRRRLPRNRRR